MSSDFAICSAVRSLNASRTQVAGVAMGRDGRGGRAKDEDILPERRKEIAGELRIGRASSRNMVSRRVVSSQERASESKSQISSVDDNPQKIGPLNNDLISSRFFLPPRVLAAAAVLNCSCHR